MNEWITLSVALMAGVALGLVFFGGLWWTVRLAVSSKWVGLLFFASLVLRTAIVMGGLFFVCDDDWRRWLASLLGFIAGRLVVTRATRQMPPLIKAQHAP